MTAQPNETTAPAVLGDLHYWTEPANLSAVESLHYRKGHSRGARTYTRKVGPPAVQHEGKGSAPAPGTAAARMLAQQLAVAGREHRADRHPHAHKAGMSAVRKYVRATDPDRLPLIVDPLAPVKPARKSPVRKPATVSVVPVEMSAGIESGRVILSVVTDAPAAPIVATPAPVVVVPFTDRRKVRRDLAETMRANGVRPSGYAWEMACRAAGLPVASVTA